MEFVVALGGRWRQLAQGRRWRAPCSFVSGNFPYKGVQCAAYTMQRIGRGFYREREGIKSVEGGGAREQRMQIGQLGAVRV